MRLNFRTGFWGGAAVLTAALLVYAFWPRPTLVDLATAQRGDLVVTVRDEGFTRVREVFELSALVGGRLLRVQPEAGDPVSASEAVANILPSNPALLDARAQSEAQAALDSAIAALGLAEAEVERATAEEAYASTELSRISALVNRGTSTQSALDRARLDLRRAETTLATARASVRMREAERDAARARLMGPEEITTPQGVVEVLSPIDGQVLRILQESEAIVAPGAPILEVGDPQDLEVVVELLSTDAVQVREHAAAEIDDWGGGETLRATVRRVEPFGFRKVSALGVEEQRVNVILDFVDPVERWESLGHGYRIEAAIEVARAEDAVTAPIASLFRHESGWAVFVAHRGRARLRPVEIGLTNGEQAEIRSGLEAGERLVLYPSETIQDGAGVRERAE